MSSTCAGPERITRATDLIARFDAVLLDSYGVLVDGSGVLPGAAAFIDALRASPTPWLVVSNDASRTVAASAGRYADLGLAIPPERILLSAALLAPYFAAHQLQGKRTIVLGPEDSKTWVRDAGGHVVDFRTADPEVVVVCDDAGYPFVEAVEAVISTVAARHRQGFPTALVVPNPDLIYPCGEGRLALTAGTTAAVIERALEAVFGETAPRFDALGKPHPAMFDAACERVGHRGPSVVMLGDQLNTDVAGARAAGLCACLVGTGVTVASAARADLVPDLVVTSLAVNDG